MDPTAPDACALLFDIDGTLIDSTYHHALAWQRAFQGLGVAVPMFAVHRAVGMGGDKLVAHVAGDAVESRIGDRLRDAWREAYVAIKDEVKPLPGATELIHAAAERGFQVALASSGDPEFATEAVEMLAVGENLAALTTAADVEGSKPDPDLLGVTISRLEGITHAVLVGDTTYDVQAARRAGIGCVGLLSGGYGEAELSGAGAVRVVTLPEDLADVDWVEICRPIDHGAR